MLIYKSLLTAYRENLSSNSKETESQLFKQSVNEATQKILIPNLFALIASISAYSAIGLTSSFSSISIYCSFICKQISFLFFLFQNIGYFKLKEISYEE